MIPKFVRNIKLFSTNGAGVKNGKVQSLNAEVKSTGANIITVQETHCTQKGKIKMNKDFVTFGGKSRPFFMALETEVVKAELGGKSLIIEMDANAKLGVKYIAGDPHVITPNGELLAGIIERHALIVGNGRDKYSGTITRRRSTRDRIERSVIDVVLFSTDLKKHFTSMHVDEQRLHVLTRIRKTKKGINIKESDHNVILTEFDCKMNKEDEQEKEEVLYNFKNKEGQQKFKLLTSNTNMLSSTINEDGDVDKVAKNFFKKIDGCIAACFKKIRVSKKKTIRMMTCMKKEDN